MLRFSGDQFRAIEAAHFKQHRPDVAVRARTRFPSLFAEHDLPDVETFAQASFDGAQVLGGVSSYDRLMEFMAINALAHRIRQDTTQVHYVKTVMSAETWDADEKIRRLFLDCATPHLPEAERDATPRRKFP